MHKALPNDDDFGKTINWMKNSIRIDIKERGHSHFSDEFDGVVELGRQKGSEEAPVHVQRFADRARVVVAPFDEDIVSREHVVLEPLHDGMVRVNNMSRVRPIRISDGLEIKTEKSASLDPPFSFQLGSKTINVDRVVAPPPPVAPALVPARPTAVEDLEVLAEQSMIPDKRAREFAPFPALESSRLAEPEFETLVRWMQSTMGVLAVAANSTEFFERAAQALIDVVQLETGAVLLRKDGDWKVETIRSSDGLVGTMDWHPSKTLLDRLSSDKRATWRSPSQAKSTEKSLSNVSALVAAPILDRNGEVIGALYGDRHFGRHNNPLPAINKLDALLVELLAHGVAVGLSRLQQEQAATIAKARFEQFFTPELATQLAEQKDFLAGRNCEVTILFADIRRFSTISDRLGPEKTVAWVNDVLGALSEAALAEEGVLVDYVGDEMVAMWGAPGEQPDHAQRACRAALAMLAALPDLNQKWSKILGEPTELGIGINTGVAFVGNTGSQRKFKYGPLGSTVNLASRVQGATKYIRTNLVITGTTKKKLTEAFHARRLATVRVKNMPDSVELHELVPERLAAWLDVRRSYEFALEEFEQRRFREALKTLGNILAQHPDDGPSAVLLSRTVNMILSEANQFDPIWDLPGK